MTSLTSKETEQLIESTIKKYQNLPQFKIKTYDEVRKIVLVKLNLPEDTGKKVEVVGVDSNIESYFDDSDEQLKARDLYDRYCEDYSIETVSERNTVVTLVYLEVLVLRFQTILNNLQKVNAANIPKDVVSSLHFTLDKIMTLKDKLGITRDKGQESGFHSIKSLQKKYRKWLSENQASRTLVCPHCHKMTMLRMKMDAWDAQKHPYFSDRLVYNEKLFKEYNKFKKTGEKVVIDETFIAEVLDVSPDYIDDVIERRRGKEE